MDMPRSNREQLRGSGTRQSRATQNKLVDAINAYQKGLALDPHSTYALCNLGVAYYAHKQPVEALASFRKALEAQPDFPEAAGWSRLGADVDR